MAVQNDKDIKKRSERMLIALLIVTVPMFLGMLLAASGLDRGAPSTVVLTKSGCEVVRLATSRFNGGVKSKQIGLIGYFLNHVGDAADLRRLLGKSRHLFRRITDRLSNAGHLVCCRLNLLTALI